MKQPTQHTITKSNPTQVCHPPPAVRRAIAIVAVAAITLVPAAFLANRIVADSAVTAHAGIVEQPAGTTVARSITYAATPPIPALAEQPIVVSCGLICDPDLGALWQQVISASDSARTSAIVADTIRRMLRAIDEAVVAAAPALP
jgi:hypothetical protein